LDNQVFPEFKNFDFENLDGEKYYQTGDFRVFEDYVKSTGFR
jgi:hypothetical protein